MILAYLTLNIFKLLTTYFRYTTFFYDVGSNTSLQGHGLIDHNYQSIGDELSLFRNSSQLVVIVVYFSSYTLIRYSLGVMSLLTIVSVSRGFIDN